MSELTVELVRLGLAFMLWAVAVWIGGSFVTAWVAWEKGREPVSWFVLAFFFSPLDTVRKSMATVPIIFAMMAVGTLATATPAIALPCPTPPPPAQTVATVGGGLSSFSYGCDGLTFSNFLAIDAGGATGLPINLVAATSTNGRVDLTLNPNLGGAGVKDIDLYFMVTGGINGIDLAVGGDNATIIERACKSAIDMTGANNCTGGLANQLAVLSNFSGRSAVAQGFGTAGVVSPVFIFKDINKGLDGGLTSMDESFMAPTPEPTTLLLFGSGLVGIGMLLRRARRFGRPSDETFGIRAAK